MSSSIRDSLTKNTTLLMATQMSTWVSGFVLMMFLPRYLGSDEYGALYLAISIQMIFQAVIDYGGQYHISKEVSRDRRNISELMSDSAVLRIGLWLLSIILTLALCEIAKYPWTTALIVMLLGASNIGRAAISLTRFGFQGIEDMKYPAIAAAVERSVVMFTVVPALLLGAKVVVVAVLMVVAMICNYWISMHFSRLLFRFKLKLHFRKVASLARVGLPYFMWSVFGIMYYRIDAVMLSMMVPASAVGWYGAAYRLFDTLMFLPVIFSQALYPILSRLSTSQFESMKNTTEKSLELLFLAGIPIAIALVVFAQPIVAFLFGISEYGPTVGIIQVFSVGIVLVYVDFVIGNTVFALDMQKQLAMVALSAVVVNIALNFVLIRHFALVSGNGGIGAAVATDLTELFVLAAGVWLLPREIFSSRLLNVTLKGAGAGLLMWLAIVAFSSLGFPWFVQGFLSVLAYAASLILLSTFEPSEIAAVRKAFNPGNIRQNLFAKKGVDA